MIGIINRRYILEEKLGTGGMGEVYRVDDRLTRSKVALKRVIISAQPESRHGASRVRLQLAHEFRILASLRHPRIIHALDYGFDEQGHPFYTMKLLENPLLLDKAVKDMPIQKRIDLILDILQALTYLHRRGIIHRDLSRSNILVDEDGNINLLDFGLAVLQKEKQRRAGTIAYMAPEILRGKPATPYSDLYALGVLAYELIAGRHPYEDMSVNDMIQHTLLETFDLTTIPAVYQPIIQRLLQKNPTDRYAKAYDVALAFSRASGQPLPKESKAIRESFLQAAQFVGREREFQQLTHALEQSLSGDGSTWLIEGESGVGKSRLLHELRTQALVNGVLVLNGQGVEGVGFPYQLWRGVIKRLVLQTEITMLEASILKAIEPELGDLLQEPIPDAPELEAEAHKLRLAVTLTELFQRQEQPILLILEDLQWTTESLDLLGHLSPLVQQRPIMIVGSYRIDERPQLPGGLSDAHVLRLERFTSEQIAELSQSMIGEAATHPQVLDLLQRETEGNAFFLVEVVRVLAEEAGRLSQIGNLTLPESVIAGGIQRVLQHRLAHVPSALQPLSQLAAVLGREVDISLLNHVFEQPQVETWLNICADAAILDIHENRWRFSHDKLREQIIRDLSGADRRALHQQAAEAIEAVYPHDTGYDEVLLEHWANTDHLDKEIHYLNAVAHQLVNTTRDYDRIDFALKRGLRKLAERDLRRVTLLNFLAQSNAAQGNYEQAYSSAKTAESIAAQANDRTNRAKSLALLGQIARDTGEIAQAKTCFKHSLDLYREIDDQAGIALLLDVQGYLEVFDGNHILGQKLVEESLEIRRSIGDEAGVMLCWDHLGVIAKYQADYERGRTYIKNAYDAAQKLGDRSTMATCLNNLGTIAMHQPDYEEAYSYFSQSLAINQAINQRSTLPLIYYNVGLAAQMMGDLEQAEDRFEHGISLSRAVGHKRMLIFNLMGSGVLDVRKERFQQAQDHLLEATQVARLANFTGLLLEVITSYALLVGLGHHDPLRAAALIGFCQHHPAAYSDVLLRARFVIDDLKPLLPQDELQRALERGTSLDLDAVVQEILDSSDTQPDDSV